LFSTHQRSSWRSTYDSNYQKAKQTLSLDSDLSHFDFLRQFFQRFQVLFSDVEFSGFSRVGPARARDLRFRCAHAQALLNCQKRKASRHKRNMKDESWKK
jgi:hypothetical protein